MAYVVAPYRAHFILFRLLGSMSLHPAPGVTRYVLTPGCILARFQRAIDAPYRAHFILYRLRGARQGRL